MHGFSASRGLEDTQGRWPPQNSATASEAVERPDDHPPERIRAPTTVGGPLESLRGEASRRATGLMGLTLARAPEGKESLAEAHGRPPDLLNPQMRGSTIWEPESIDPKARVRAHQTRRPIVEEGARMRHDPWPSPGSYHRSGHLFWVSITAREGPKIILTKRGQRPTNPKFPHFHPFHHLTPSHAKTRRERALPPNGGPPTPALSV